MSDFEFEYATRTIDKVPRYIQDNRSASRKAQQGREYARVFRHPVSVRKTVTSARHVHFTLSVTIFIPLLFVKPSYHAKADNFVNIDLPVKKLELRGKSN